MMPVGDTLQGRLLHAIASSGKMLLACDAILLHSEVRKLQFLFFEQDVATIFMLTYLVAMCQVSRHGLQRLDYLCFCSSRVLIGF